MVDNYINKIIQHPLFLKLKDVVENNGYHDHETVYDHLIKTKNTAIREIRANFITNQGAKNSFLTFVNENFHGMKRSDIMILIALLHDIGKILYVKAGDHKRSIVVTNNEGITYIPGHEYWGSTIVAEVLKDLNLKSDVVSYIANVVRLHDTFSEIYFNIKKGWSMETLLNDVKSRAEGLYIETLFNIYCDCFTALPFQSAKETIIKIFNEPMVYVKREYVTV